MKNINKNILYLIAVIFINACNTESLTKIVPFIDLNGKYIGDSIFLNEKIMKIIFTDTSIYIDSIVFDYHHHDNQILKSKQTFMDGRLVFENIAYYKNGNIKIYTFIDDDKETCYYRRFYSLSGMEVQTSGELFFQGYIEGITDNFEIKIGDTIGYSIFYPNPPDCKTDLYIKIDNEPYFVFSKSAYIDCLQTVTASYSDIGFNETDIWLSIKDNHTDSIQYYNKPLFIKAFK